MAAELFFFSWSVISLWQRGSDTHIGIVMVNTIYAEFHWLTFMKLKKKEKEKEKRENDQSSYTRRVRVLALCTYEGKSISNQPIPFLVDRDTKDFHALFQYMF